MAFARRLAIRTISTFSASYPAPQGGADRQISPDGILKSLRWPYLALPGRTLGWVYETSGLKSLDVFQTPAKSRAVLRNNHWGIMGKEKP